MSDVENVNVDEYMVDDFYGEPYDIVKFISPTNADEFMSFLIDEAVDFYVDKQYSPIIQKEKIEKKEKVNGAVVDYNFLVDTLSRFIEKKVMSEVRDEKFVKNVRRKFKNDFSESGNDFNENASFVLAILSFLKIVVFYRKNRYFLTRTAYSYFCHDKMNDEVFLFSGVILNSQFTEKYNEEINKIGNKKDYKMLGFGASFVSRLILKLQREEKKIIQF